MQPSTGLPGATTVWQNPQAAPLYTAHDATAAAAVQGPSWDPTMQAGRSTFVSAASTFPSQPFASSSVPAYPAPPGSSPLMPAVQLNVQPGGASPPGRSPYFGQ